MRERSRTILQETNDTANYVFDELIKFMRQCSFD